MNNLSTTAKKLDKVLEIVNIVFGALVIASIVIIALAGVSYALDWSTDSLIEGFASFDIGFLEIEVAQDYTPDRWMILLQAVIILGGGCAAIYLARKGVVYVREILKPMADEKPFDSIVSTNLRKLAKLSIVIGILCNAVILAEQFILIFAYDLRGLVLSDKIPMVDFNLEVDLGFLITWAILMLLSYVFRYGEQLQQLSDETV